MLELNLLRSFNSRRASSIVITSYSIHYTKLYEAIAAHKFAVEVNPLLEEVIESLPLAQCGGCGYPGCEGYARAVVSDPDVPPNLCFPGKEKVANRVAELTGKKMVASYNFV